MEKLCNPTSIRRNIMTRYAKSKTKFAYGWKPDLPDLRDQAYSAPSPVIQELPPSFDLRPQCPPIVNQGQLGSCTSCAIASAHYFDQLKEDSQAAFQPSRLFIYYNERAIEGSTATDAGGYIRDGFKSVATQGVCPETEWPYDISKFAQEPPAPCFLDAQKYKAIQYLRLQQSLAQMKGCLVEGYPFVFGFTVYQSFESDEVARTGIVPLPTNGESTVGGHAVMAVGYDDATQRFTIQNSWSTNWGDQGFCYMPYSYLADVNLCNDFWTMRQVEL
jgi:C1A family cysteine protease